MLFFFIQKSIKVLPSKCRAVYVVPSCRLLCLDLIFGVNEHRGIQVTLVQRRKQRRNVATRRRELKDTIMPLLHEENGFGWYVLSILRCCHCFENCTKLFLEIYSEKYILFLFTLCSFIC